MKTLKLFAVLIAAVLFINTNLFSQVRVKADVTNQQIIGNYVYFDIYLMQDAGSSGPCYLGTCDFKFTFNNTYFTTPVLSRVATSTSLHSTDGTLLTTYPFAYNVTGNTLTINTNIVAFADQAEFDAMVARIDATPLYHKLGTFRVLSAVPFTTGTMGLTWKTGVGGTVITTFAPVDPWNLTATVNNLTIIPDLPLPIELTSFTGNVANKRDVTLNWSTASENNNKGFEIERKANTTETWSNIGYIDGKGTTTTTTSYTFSDRRLNTGKYNYRLKQIDYNGNFEYYNLNGVIEIGVPNKYDISQNYPNPFNPTTKIDFDLPFDSKVSIKLYDMSGREVKTLVNSQKTAGYYTETFNMSTLSSGAYFYRISANGNNQNFVATKKLVLVK